MRKLSLILMMILLAGVIVACGGDDDDEDADADNQDVVTTPEVDEPVVEERVNTAALTAPEGWEEATEGNLIAFYEGEAAADLNIAALEDEAAMILVQPVEAEMADDEGVAEVLGGGVGYGPMPSDAELGDVEAVTVGGAGAARVTFTYEGVDGVYFLVDGPDGFYGVLAAAANFEDREADLQETIDTLTFE